MSLLYQGVLRSVKRLITLKTIVQSIVIHYLFIHSLLSIYYMLVSILGMKDIMVKADKV